MNYKENFECFVCGSVTHQKHSYFLPENAKLLIPSTMSINSELLVIYLTYRL